MPVDAYRRARKLLTSLDDVRTARILGVIQSLLILGLLVVICLFVELMASRGATRSTMGGLVDAGLTPLIETNLKSGNPVHRVGAVVLDTLTNTRFWKPLRNNMGALATLLALGLLFLLALSLLSQWRHSVMARAVTELATTLRNQIHRQMYRLGQSSLPTEGTGPVVNIWTREVNDIRDGFLADLNVTPRTYVLAGGLLLLALLTSPILTVFLASLGLLVWVTSRVMDRDARLAHDAALRDASLQLCLLHEDLGLLRTVRIYGGESYDRQRFDEHLDRFRQADIRRIETESRPSPTTWLLYGAALILALGMLGYNVVVQDRISISTMLILIASLAGLAIPILEWLKLRRALRLANRSAKGVFEFLERSPELHQNVGARLLTPVKEQIALSDVSLESRSGRALLEKVSVEIPAGARTSILGLEDDSKLALACLIPRLIDPKSGRLKIDGRDLRDFTLESVRAQSATVLQADLVFTDSVLINIGMGEPINNLPRVIEAAKIAHAHHFIQDLPHGYDTIIGPLGHFLKPDEQFRIALARAYLHDPSILIVEEPHTPLDDDTSHLIDDTLGRLALGRTLVLIPHRLSSIRSSDHVILLHNNRLADAGAPAHLQSESKLFRHILYVQFNQYAEGEIEAGQMVP